MNKEIFNLQNFLNIVQNTQLGSAMIEEPSQVEKSSVIERFKRGRKIKIKKQNKGKFTEYCKGKVTSECIQKGKNSDNPKIRKRAIFAQNARLWNH